MADLDTNTAILIAIITAFSVVVGGLVTSGVNFLIEWRKGKREAAKVKLDKETRELELRDQAYIKFLSITLKDLMVTNKFGLEEFHPELAEESVALVLTHGSPAIRAKVTADYPFTGWGEFRSAKQSVMSELLTERGGFDLYVKHMRPLVEDQE